MDSNTSNDYSVVNEVDSNIIKNGVITIDDILTIKDVISYSMYLSNLKEEELVEFGSDYFRDLYWKAHFIIRNKIDRMNEYPIFFMSKNNLKQIKKIGNNNEVLRISVLDFLSRCYLTVDQINDDIDVQSMIINDKIFKDSKKFLLRAINNYIRNK